MRNLKFGAFALVLSVSAVVQAQQSKPNSTFREFRTSERVSAGRVTSVNVATGQLGPWQHFAPSSLRATWAMAFDTMNFDIGSNTAFSGIYGQTPGFFRFSNQYKNPFVALDVQRVAPGSEGRVGKRFLIDMVWNPGGTYDRSGSGRLAIAVVTAASFGTGSASASFFTPLGPAIPGTPFSGVVLDFGVQPHGWRTYDADLSSTNFSIPIPNSASEAEPAALVFVIGTINASGQFAMAPSQWCMQPTLDTMSAPNDPNYPGVNPSQSGPLQWDDDGGSLVTPAPNGFHDNLLSTNNVFTEQYSYDWSGSVAGFPQASVTLLYDTNGGRFFGNVFSVPPQRKVDVTLVACNDDGVPLANPEGVLASHDMTLPIAATGGYEFGDVRLVTATGAESSTVLAVFGGRDHVLRRVVGPIYLNASDRLPDVQLDLGDVDMSGEVDAADIDLLIANFGQIIGTQSWNPNWDVDSTGQIDAADIDVVIASFGSSGDRMPTLP